MRTALSISSRTAGVLLIFAVAGTALLAYTFDITRSTIEHNEELAKLALINQALPAGLYDNDLIRDQLMLPPDPLLGTDEPTQAYRATLQGRPVALVLEAIAPDGYSGKIKLLVAIRANGEISGVRVVAHNETPGLGDYIDIARNDWIKHFDHRSASEYSAEDWQVKKDGGKFDHMAGATITPRAVVKAVYKALQYFEQHRATLFVTGGDARQDRSTFPTPSPLPPRAVGARDTIDTSSHGTRFGLGLREGDSGSLRKFHVEPQEAKP
jgi:Na+-translocating ferredoxin:NAD+ oxidoreductase subunit G